MVQRIVLANRHEHAFQDPYIHAQDKAQRKEQQAGRNVRLFFHQGTQERSNRQSSDQAGNNSARMEASISQADRAKSMMRVYDPFGIFPQDCIL